MWEGRGGAERSGGAKGAQQRSKKGLRNMGIIGYGSVRVGSGERETDRQFNSIQFK